MPNLKGDARHTPEIAGGFPPNPVCTEADARGYPMHKALLGPAQGHDAGRAPTSRRQHWRASFPRNPDRLEGSRVHLADVIENGLRGPGSYAAVAMVDDVAQEAAAVKAADGTFSKALTRRAAEASTTPDALADEIIRNGKLPQRTWLGVQRRCSSNPTSWMRTSGWCWTSDSPLTSYLACTGR